MRKRTIFPCWDKGKKSYKHGGRVQCDVCGSFDGVRAKNYLRKGKDGKTYLKLFRRCVKCGSLEIINNWTGAILEQKINEEMRKKNV